MSNSRARYLLRFKEELMRIIVCLVLCALCSGMVRGAERPPTCRIQVGAENQRLPLDFTGALPVPDYLDAAFACTAPKSQVLLALNRPASSWISVDSQRHAQLLARRQFAWLVVPAQTQYFGFDHAERALISAAVADAFSDQGAAPDTALVMRALGEPRRRYEPPAIQQLAAALRVTRRLDIYVGHDGKRKFTLTLQLMKCTAGGCKLSVQRNWRALAFTDEVPAAAVIRGLTASMRTEMLGIGPAKSAAPKPLPGSALGDTPAALAAGEPAGDPAEVAALLAGLAPQDAPLARERLHVWALNTALRNSSSRWFAAKAAFDLHRRPYALKLLEGAMDPASQTLRSLLNGNLLEAQASLATVKEPLLRLLLAFEVQDLREFYGRDGAFDATLVPKTFGKVARQWRTLAMRRASDSDGWGATNSPELQLLLDKAFAASRTGELDPDSPQDDVEIVTLRRARRAFATLDPAHCCAAGSASNYSWQVHWLLEALAEANAIKDITRLLDVQGLPDAALRDIAIYDRYLAGMPEFELLRARSSTEQAKKSVPADAQRLSQQASKAVQLASYWSQGQSPTSFGSLPLTAENLILLDAYSRDVPRRPYWRERDYIFFGAYEPIDDACAALAQSSREMQPASTCLYLTQPPRRERLRADLAQRFHGHPNAAAVLAEYQSTEPTSADRLALLRAAVKADPASWRATSSLGLSLITEAGRYEEAQRVYLDFPGFKPPRAGNAVGLTNMAIEAGAPLYGHGRYELARPLLKLAADLGTGSESNYLGIYWLAVLDRNFPRALETLRNRATRYQSDWAYHDYLALLFAMGQREAAQRGFAQLSERFEEGGVWRSLLVGQRMSGMTDEQFRAWILSPQIREAHFRGLRLAAPYAISWVMIDREPPADFPALMRQVELNAVRRIGAGGIVTERPGTEPSGGMETMSPTQFRFGAGGILKEGTPVKSEYVLLADALVPLYAANYPQAYAAFTALADRYALERGELAAMLPYFALAAAKTGDALKLEDFIEARPDAEVNFDVWLSRAFFAAIRHQPDVAANALDHAFWIGASNDRLIDPSFQYAQACEIVARETGDARFLRMALDWAKRHQRIAPTRSWAYSLEADLSKVGADVTRALAMTIYLDPTTPRLKKFSAQQLATAREWLRANNPFLKPAPPR